MNSFNPRNELGFALAEATHTWRQALDRRLRPLGLSQATWRALFHLERRGEAVSQRELAERMGIVGPSLVRLIDALEAGGLVERQGSPTDRRCKLLHLTARARGLLIHIHAAADEVRDRLLDGLSDDDLDRTKNLLQQVAANAERLKTQLSET